MFTFNAFQGIPGNVYLLLALLAAVCILLVALLLILFRGNKRVTVNADTPSPDKGKDYAQKQVQPASQQLRYQQSLQEQMHEDLGPDAQTPPPQDISIQPVALERSEQNNGSSSMRQALQPLAVQERCSLCGKVVQPGDMFCMNCGNRLKLTSPRLSVGKRPAARGEHASNANGTPSSSFPAAANQVSTASSQDKTLLDPNAIPQKLVRGMELAGRLTLRSNNKNLRDYPLDKLQMFIGRSTNNDIMIAKDKLTSRHHAIIRYEDGCYVLLDDHSANGTYLNDRKIMTVSPHPLYDGDVIKIGVNEFIFHLDDVQYPDVEDVPTLAVEPAVSVNDTKDPRVEELMQSMITDIHSPLAEIYSQPLPPVPSPTQTPNVPVEIPSQQMSFTTFHPKDAPVDIWNTLLVYAHQDSTREAVYEDADRFRQELEDIPANLSSPLEQPLLAATNITIVPECKGVVFNPRRLSFKWTDDWHRLMFRFSIKKEMLGVDTTGRINIFAGPLLIATLQLSMILTEQVQPEQVSGAEATTRPYKRVFASYSTQDKAIAQAYRDVSRVLGIAVQQREELRSLEVLNDTLKQAIEEAEIFQLFWSSHAAKSAYNRQEWEYALQLQRPAEFLRPVYWQVPLIAVPKQLAGLQITYLPSYTFLK